MVCFHGVISTVTGFINIPEIFQVLTVSDVCALVIGMHLTSRKKTLGQNGKESLTTSKYPLAG